MAANATFLSGNVFEGSELGSWSLDEEEFRSPFSWVEESSEDDLDYGAEDLVGGALDYTIGLWVVDRGEHCLRADGVAEFPKVLVVELLVVIDY